MVELQADEMRTIIGGRGQAIWVFVAIDVWSRLWPSTVVGKRSYRNTLDLFRDLSNRMNLEVTLHSLTMARMRRSPSEAGSKRVRR
jgi:hypothetical protein